MQIFATFSALAVTVSIAFVNAVPQLAGRQIFTVSDDATITTQSPTAVTSSIAAVTAPTVPSSVIATPASSEAPYSTCVVEGPIATMVVYMVEEPATSIGNFTDIPRGTSTSIAYAGNTTVTGIPGTSTSVGNTAFPVPTTTSTGNSTVTTSTSTFLGNATSTSTVTPITTSTYVGNFTESPSGATTTVTGSVTFGASGGLPTTSAYAGNTTSMYPACSVAIGNNSSEVTVIYTNSNGTAEWYPSGTLDFGGQKASFESNTDAAIPVMLSGWMVISLSSVALLVGAAL